VAITSRKLPHHTDDFARAAAADEAQEKMIASAKALAMTGIDFLSDPLLRENAKKSFQKKLTV
jgi:hypothetical protein